MTPQPPFSGLLEAARTTVANARHRLRLAAASHEYYRAEAEAEIAATFDLGKNEAERRRNLTCHLERTPGPLDSDWIGVYQGAAAEHRGPGDAPRRPPGLRERPQGAGGDRMTARIQAWLAELKSR